MAFNLASLRHGPNYRPPRIVVYGPEKVGKSTFASGAPKPIYVTTEEGIDALDVTSFPIARSLEDVREALGALVVEEHDFGTVVLDSADWLEMLIHKSVAEKHNAPGIQGSGEKGDPLGYGKGYGFALTEWKDILEALDVLRNEKGMIVIVLAHFKVKRYDDPSRDSYDRQMLDLHDSSAALLKEWADVIGFLTQRITIDKEDVGFNKKLSKAKGGGDRLLHLEDRPAYVAGNRYGLVETLSIPRIGGWQVFQDELTRAMTPLPPATEETKTKGRARALEQKESASGK